MDKLTDSLIEVACARHAHSANRTFCMALGIELPEWDDLDSQEKQKLHNIVEFVLAGGTAESKHVIWCQRMREDGWQYGPRRDNIEKLNPMLVKWEELPHTQQAREELQVASIRLMALVLGHSKTPYETKTMHLDLVPESHKEEVGS